MSRRDVTAMALLLVLVLFGHAASGQQAYVQAADQVGQAWLFRKDGRCHALTPAHVVGSGDVADLRVSDVGAAGFARARVVERWNAEDLALLTIESGSVTDCGPLLALPIDVGAALTLNASGELRFVDNRGGYSIRAATVIELDDAMLAVRSSENLVKSMSGSVLFVASTPAGMLLNVPTEGRLQGGGVMLRMDVATRLALDRLARGATPSASSARPRCGTEAASPDDVAARANGGAIVSWTALPESPAFGPENLLAGDACRPWQVRQPEYPVSLVIDLAGEGPLRVREVALDAGGDGLAAAPREVEIYTRLGATGGWTSVGTARFGDRDARVTIPLAQVPAAQIMIKIYSGRRTDRLALGRVHVLRVRLP